jgi:hypothetical protein
MDAWAHIKTYITKEKRIMENTFEPSFPLLFRSKITVLEAIEHSFLGFVVWCLGLTNALKEPGASLSNQFPFLLGLELIILGSWAIYNIYIRLARAGGRRVDTRLWILASLLTGTYTFWAWSILDINRLMVSKLFYRGEAPVEYAWSSQSKQIRKAWEQAAKVGQP